MSPEIDLTENISSLGLHMDSVDVYFECLTSCSIDDGECVTRCVDDLKNTDK